MLNPSLIRVGGPSRVLNNCIHHGAERMNIDIENNINKIYRYFSIYTVRTEQPKEYCEFVNCEYKRLLSLIARQAGSPCFLEFQDCWKCFYP